MRSLKLSPPLVALVLLLAPLPGRSAAERITQSTDVIAVEVPVQVLRDGKPVSGLTAADFELYDGKKPQSLTGFEVFDLKGMPTDRPAAATLSPSARRRFLLFFDLGFSQQTRLARAQDAARKLLDGGFHPTDLIGVAAYSPSKGPQLLLGFTPDRGAVRQAIDNLGFSERARTAFDPLVVGMFSGGGGPNAAGASRAADRREAVAAQGGGGGGGGGGGEGGGQGGSGGGSGSGSGVDPTSPSEDVVSTAGAADLLGEGLRSFRDMVDEGMRSGRRQDVDAFLLSVESFAKTLSAVQGRKQVVLLSEGFDSNLLMGVNDHRTMVGEAEAATRGRYWEVSSDKRFGNTKSVDRLEKMMEALRRADCVVQSVDIAGVRDTGGKTTLGGEDGLYVMANGTGGELYRNFNDLGEAVGKLLERTSVTYVLAFQPDVARNGEYHKIRVELKDKSVGKLVYRPGYYAPLPYADQKPLERLLATSGAVVSGREGGAVPLAVLAAPFAMSAEKAYVPVVIEIGGAGLLAGSKQGTATTEVYVYALDATGTVRDYFTQTLGLDLAKVGEAVRAGGVKFFGDLELPPGSYAVRVLVRNGETGATGLRAVALDVPAFADGKPVLLQAFQPVPTDGWLMARETNSREGDLSLQFTMRGKSYVPASRPTLQGEQEVALAVVGYRLAEGVLSARATILSADGREVGEGRIRLLGRESAAGGVVRFAAAFRPPKLAPGDYVLLLTLTGSKGETESSATPFVMAAGG
jgi:VWFA-related protein